MKYGLHWPINYYNNWSIQKCTKWKEFAMNNSLFFFPEWVGSFLSISFHSEIIALKLPQIPPSICEEKTHTANVNQYIQIDAMYGFRNIWLKYV